MADALSALSQAGVSVWLDDLIGVSYADSMRTLEDEGVARFGASWTEVSDHLAETLRAQPTRTRR